MRGFPGRARIHTRSMQTWNLDDFGGIASRAQLAAAGATPTALADAVRAGALVRLRRGTYAHPEARGPAVEAAKAGGRLSCVSAARSYGWWGGMDVRTHLRVPPTARSVPALAAAVVHWTSSEPCGQSWRVSPADCLRSVVRCADEETAVAVPDTAVSSGAFRLSDLPRVFAHESRRARSTALLARPGSDSGVESIVRQRLTKVGYAVEQQVAVPGVGRVDLRVDGWLFIELDGYAYHGDRDAFERDRARDLGLAVRGGSRLRFSARQVLNEWDAVLDCIRHVERQEGSRDTPSAAPFARNWAPGAAKAPSERRFAEASGNLRRRSALAQTMLSSR